MIITTTDFVPNKEITEILGIARGSTVRARSMIDGDMEKYTQQEAQYREQAIQRMQEDAESLNADAIINVRMMTSVVLKRASETLAYGTAVKLK